MEFIFFLLRDDQLCSLIVLLQSLHQPYVTYQLHIRNISVSIRAPLFAMLLQKKNTNNASLLFIN